MAAGLGEIKQKKSSWGSTMNNTFVLFYFPKPRNQVWILKYRGKSIGWIIVSKILRARNGFSVLKSVCRLRLKRAWRAFCRRKVFKRKCEISGRGNAGSLVSIVLYYITISEAAKRRGKYAPLASDTEVNNCFSIYSSVTN